MKGWELAKQDGCGVVGGSFHPNIVYSVNFSEIFSQGTVFFLQKAKCSRVEIEIVDNIHI
jgi:hypothetical protein